MTSKVRLTARRKPAARKEGNRRPLDFDVRGALVAATTELLRSANSAEPSVVEIARRANVNPGLIGYYFGSKDSLLMHVLEQDMTSLHDQLRALVELDAPVVEKVRRHIAELIEHFQSKPYVNQLILTLVRRGPPEMGDRITEGLMRPITEVHAQLLAQGVTAGVLRPIDPMLFYFTMLGACDRIFSARYSLTALFGHSEIDEALRARFVQHTIDILLPGLLADPASTR